MSSTSTQQDARNRLPGSSSNYHKRRFGRSRKRKNKFYGDKDDDAPPSKRSRSSSSKKIKSGSTESSETKNRIIDINILFPKLESILCCQKCHGTVTISESGHHGLGFKINVMCTDCDDKILIESSKTVGPRGTSYEVNRSVLAARALGHGHAGLTTFCGIMDLQQPVVHSAFDSINEQLSHACESVAQESMKTSVQEEIAATGSKDLVISGDGSWRRKGHSSLQGIASVAGINTGKIIDVAVKSSFCNACAKWEGKEETAAYQEWFDEHEHHCSSNHTGSSGKMEVDGILEIFNRSEEKYGVRYTKYVGDGDSKVFSAVSEAKPYGNDFLVQKKECVGHVQKRMGTRLRNLKKTLGSTRLSDGKTIGGQGRLTARQIDQLSIYYGNAIRANCESVKNMSDSIWATYYHKISTDDKPQHHLCPKGVSSWCQWQKSKAHKKLKKFHHKSSIPPAVMERIKSIYEDLSKPELLERCLGGYTQNSNESFNNSVWRIVPKTSFSGLRVLKIGVYIAVTCFNDGRSGFLQIMEKFDIKPGHSAIAWVQRSDDSRLFFAERKTLASSKEARRAKRHFKLQTQEDAYGAGEH